MPPLPEDGQSPSPVRATGRGRPLRFLMLVLLLWTGGRSAILHIFPRGEAEEEASGKNPAPPMLLSNTTSFPPAGQAAARALSLQLLASRDGAHPFVRQRRSHPETGPDDPALWRGAPLPRPSARLTANKAGPLPPVLPSAATDTAYAEPAPSAGATSRTAALSRASDAPHLLPYPSSPPPALPSSAPGSGRQWVGSAWLLWRERGSPSAFSNAGQLGGAQAGMRVDHFLTKRDDGEALPVSLYGRVSGALRQPVAPEAALGIALHPLSGRTPLSLGLERRIALDTHARNGFALIAATGLNPTPLRSGSGQELVAEGYAQAGMVGLARRDPFIDGRFSITAPLDRQQRLSAGLSLSGGAQPGISRLDIGPVAQWRTPFDLNGARLLLEWRERIAGSAQPGSGPVLTLASDF